MFGSRIASYGRRSGRRGLAATATARRVTIVAALAAGMLVGTAGAARASTTIQLLLPQSNAFSILGHSCGGIQEQAFATGFDPTTGYPTGDVYMQTRCGGSGRGGGYHTTTYSAWATVTWDFTGAVVSDATLSTAPVTDPTFSAFDANGNEIYNASNSAFLALAPTFVPAPRVTAVSAITGPAGGGTSVTITGTGFTGATDVSFGGVSAAFVVDSDTSISSVAPAAPAGTVDVIVTSAGGASAASPADQFTFVAAATVTGVVPNSGPISGGTTVTITGSGMAAAASVSFGDMPAGFSVNDDSSLTAYSPPAEAAGTVAITVTSIGGTSATNPADLFTYTTVTNPLSPTVTKITPNYGSPSGGSVVTISGANFTGTTDVEFGTTPATAFTLKSDASMTATAPPGTGVVDVTLTNASGTSAVTSADQFSYGPVVTKVSPAVGAAGGGTRVTISGHNFAGATDVSFGGTSASRFTVNATGTSITAFSPPEPDSGVQPVDVTVTNADGTSAITPLDVFTYVAPTVSTIVPANGSAGGNTKVVISGHFFGGTTDVTFGGVEASTFTVNSTGTRITAVTPPEAGSGVQSVDVSVTTAAGTATVPAGFTYVAPTVVKISPVSGPVAGGTTVTITGVNLYGATEVDFGTTPASITKMTNTSLTVVSPPGSGTVDVTVTNEAGTSATGSFDLFTY